MRKEDMYSYMEFSRQTTDNMHPYDIQEVYPFEVKGQSCRTVSISVVARWTPVKCLIKEICDEIVIVIGTAAGIINQPGRGDLNTVGCVVRCSFGKCVSV